MISIELEVNKLSSLLNIFRESPEQEASLVDEETDVVYVNYKDPCSNDIRLKVTNQVR